MKLAIQLSETQEKRLAEIAARLNVPVESLAEAAVRELVDQSKASSTRWPLDSWRRIGSCTSVSGDEIPQPC